MVEKYDFCRCSCHGVTGRVLYMRRENNDLSRRPRERWHACHVANSEQPTQHVLQVSPSPLPLCCSVAGSKATPPTSAGMYSTRFGRTTPSCGFSGAAKVKVLWCESSVLLHISHVHHTAACASNPFIFETHCHVSRLCRLLPRSSSNVCTRPVLLSCTSYMLPSFVVGKAFQRF